MTLRGDVVEYTGTDRQMEPNNGYGDWNIAWSDYKQRLRARRLTPWTLTRRKL